MKDSKIFTTINPYINASTNKDFSIFSTPLVTVPSQVWISENFVQKPSTIENLITTTKTNEYFKQTKNQHLLTNWSGKIPQISNSLKKNFTLQLLNSTLSPVLKSRLEILNNTIEKSLNTTFNSSTIINPLNIESTKITYNKNILNKSITTTIETLINTTNEHLSSVVFLPYPKVIWPKVLNLNSYDTNQTSLKKLNCTEKYKKMAADLMPAFLCDCDGGKLRDISQKCVKAHVATFRARISKLCGVRAHDFLTTHTEAKIIKMKVNFILRNILN